MVEINNLTHFKISKKLLKSAAEKVLKSEGKKKLDLSVALVDEKTIKEFNKKYRKKNQPTDVLSFGQADNGERIAGLNEIVICPFVVKKNAVRLKVAFNDELKRVLIHGVLHVLGHDHERSRKDADIMFGKEEKYLFKYKS